MAINALTFSLCSHDRWIDNINMAIFKAHRKLLQLEHLANTEHVYLYMFKAIDIQYITYIYDNMKGVSSR